MRPRAQTRCRTKGTSTGEKRGASPARWVTWVFYAWIRVRARKEEEGREEGTPPANSRWDHLSLTIPVPHESSSQAEIERRRPADWLVWKTTGANPKKCERHEMIRDMSPPNLWLPTLKKKQFLRLRPSWLNERGRDRRTHLDSHLIWISCAWGFNSTKGESHCPRSAGKSVWCN